MKQRSTVFHVAVLSATGIFLILPLLMALYVVFTRRPVLVSGEYATPLSVAWRNIETVFSHGSPVNAVFNSFMVGFGSAMTGFALGFPVAYILARFQFRGKTLLLGTLLLLRLIPKIPVLSGYYHIIAHIGLMNHHASIILVRGGGILIAIWIMKAAIETVPRELELAAILDGFSPGFVMIHITMRLAFPGILAAFLLEFVSAWNGFLLPLLFMDKQGLETVALGIDRFLAGNAFDLGPTTAFALLVSLPLLIVIPRLMVGALSPYRHRLSGGDP